jgi:hydrogenase maturation protein HypF
MSTVDSRPSRRIDIGKDEMHSHEQAIASERARWGLRICGTVQGVGFRPALYRLACRLGLAGLVRNDDQGVWVEIEGAPVELMRFKESLIEAAPPLARIDRVEVQWLACRGGQSFDIVATTSGAAAVARIPPDVAPCADCLRELGDPADRRHRYPFINCTACGPRYSIIQELPYDRRCTTMASFTLCARCRREYGDAADRRFHAEPNGCAQCGPRLTFFAPGQRRSAGNAALKAAIARLHRGDIVAVRGVGGFLFAADACNPATVERLRERKRRPHKPFALMARDLAEAERVAHIDDGAARALKSAARPIVLLRARGATSVAPAVAPGLRELGIMLPATPLHHLLLADGPPLQIMTSGNRADEPLAKDNDEAERRLGDIADAFLEHNRPIHTRVDDSVVRVVAGGLEPVRRARGVAPEPIALPFSGDCVLAVGGELKNTVCLTRGDEAFVSQHLGDLGHPSTFALFEETIAKLARLYDLDPVCVAHDLHPDYHSTRWAHAQPQPRVPVQHHHAHVAACLAEHGHLGRAIGVAFDGTGCGPDGELWGGEILIADLAGFRRLGHLRALPLAGGEAAIRQPWRLAVAALDDAGEPIDLLLRRCEARRLAAVRHLLTSTALSPRATSAGRWFDAIAAILGVRDEISYEGQAAVELEALAGEVAGALLPFEITPGDPFTVDLRPTVRQIARELARGAPTSELAASFHETMAAVVVAACNRARSLCAVDTVALSGGCFQNTRLSARCRTLLAEAGFEVLVHRRVPPNDGGLSLGQAAVAAFRRSLVRADLQGGPDVSRHTR